MTIQKKEAHCRLFLFTFPVRINEYYRVLNTADKYNKSFKFYDPTRLERENQAQETVSYVKQWIKDEHEDQRGKASEKMINGKFELILLTPTKDDDLCA